MSTFAKIMLGVLIGMIVLSAAGIAAFVFLFSSSAVILGREIHSTRANVPAVAAEIATFKLPTGFKPDYAFNGGEFALAAYRGTDDRSHLFLAKGPSFLKLDSAELKRYIEDQPGSQPDEQATQAGTYETQVRGQAITIYFTEAIRDNGRAYTTASFAFQSENGPAAISLSRPSEDWSEDEVKAFVASIQ